MRLNAKELIQLAQNCNCEKEGVLSIKEKHDGLLRRSEAYVERYFRLKGNLLFYFKNKESFPKSEPLGLMVLERCTVELESQEEVPNAFVIVCEGETNVFKFAAVSEESRDSWIQALHIASYECLKMQLDSLVDNLQGKTGSHPYPGQVHRHSGVDLDSQMDEQVDEDCILEMSFSCKDLPCDSNGQLPNPLIVIHTLVPPDQTLWTQHNHTEIVEKNTQPEFLKSVGFGDRDMVDLMTRVKVTVYNVVERMTSTMMQIGFCIFTIRDAITAVDNKLTMNIVSSESQVNGQLTILSWMNGTLTIPELFSKQLGQNTPVPSYSRNSIKSISKSKYSPKPHFDNVICKSFRFATNFPDTVLQVHEYMAESQWTFDMPVKLIHLFIDEEKKKISLLQDMGELYSDKNLRQEMYAQCMNNITKYTQHMSNVEQHTSGPFFKPSCEKDNKDLQFAPTNVHLQRIAVSIEKSDSAKVYDSITMGAFADHILKFKNGGLRRHLQTQQDAYAPESTLGPRTKIHKACSVLSDLAELKYVINEGCEKLCQTLINEKTDEVQARIDVIANKSRKLVELCDDKLLHSSSAAFSQAKAPTSQVDGKDSMTSLSQVKEQKSKEKLDETASEVTNGARASMRSGITPPVEPWEVTRLNLEAAVVCLISKVEEMLKTCKNQETDTSKTAWLSEISPAVGKLQSFVNIIFQRANLFLTFLSLRENRFNIKNMHNIKYRRDVLTSQAVSSLVPGIISRVYNSKNNLHFFSQISKIGLLVKFEGLLSCYGDELGMLEDMYIAVEDLSFVTFSFSLSSEKQVTATPTLMRCLKTGKYPDINRHCININLGVTEDVFEVLPQSLKNGDPVKIVPLLFNVGINEQATVAERFGSTSLQDEINAEGFVTLKSYFDSFSSLIESKRDSIEKNIGITRLIQQLNILTNNTKKSKNVEILHLAEEICRKMYAVQYVNCKSGKDRTSMAVTLQQVQILQQEHDLASHVFWQSLDCFRSVGCRRENTFKNAGVRKYAFNSLQLLSFPKLYRPPSGTYGNIQT